MLYLSFNFLLDNLRYNISVSPWNKNNEKKYGFSLFVKSERDWSYSVKNALENRSRSSLFSAKRKWKVIFFIYTSLPLINVIFTWLNFKIAFYNVIYFNFQWWKLIDKEKKKSYKEIKYKKKLFWEKGTLNTFLLNLKNWVD